MKARNVYRRLTGLKADDDVQAIRERLDRMAGRIGGSEKKAAGAAKDAELHVRELNRIAPQLAALETKVEDLRQVLEATPRVDGPDDLVQARSLVETIQREHQQIRLRLSAVTTYEERLRRIEEQLGLPHD